ncbi:MAG: tetratricopeptide (TPR) repeat protein [Crocinitomix sp.]|jgi:tetratricopeptide (TPR) repeat protein
MMKNSENSVLLIFNRTIIGVLMLLLVASCNNSKKAEEVNIYTQRKIFKSEFHQANSEKIIGHYEKAIALFEHCLVIEPNNHAVHFALSDLYQTQGDKDKTLQHAESAYTNNKTNKWYALRLADLYFERNEFAKTADLYAAIIAEEKNVDIKFKYVDALIRAKRFPEAITMLNEIEVETGVIPELTFTKYDLYLQLGETEKAEEEITHLLNENPTDSDYKIMVADFYIQQKQFVKSKDLIQSVIKDNPDYGQAYIMMADLDLRQNNVTGAFDNLKKGFLRGDVELDRKLEIARGLLPYTSKNERDYKEMRLGVAALFDIIYDPSLGNGKMHNYYGDYWTSLENYAKAEEQYEIAIEIDPSSFNLWLRLLDAQSNLENYKGLAANGEKAAELFPAQPIIYLLTGIGTKELEDYEKAEEWFFLGKDLVVQDPQLQSEFLYQLGDMNYRQSNLDEGAFYFDQALQSFAGNINVYADKATRLINDNKLDLAETEIKKGIESAPKSSKLLNVYGQILFKKKEYKNAGDTFLKVLYENYSDGIILERYADALFLDGEKDKAIELWGEAIKFGNKSALLKRKFENKTYYKPE